MIGYYNNSLVKVLMIYFLHKNIKLSLILINILYVIETTTKDLNQSSTDNESLGKTVPDVKKITNPRKRKSSIPIKKQPTLMQMSDEELLNTQKKALAEKNFSLAIKCLERRMKLNTNPETLATLIFELGEIQFESGKLEASIITFNEFKKQFAGHKEIEEVYYKTCVASFLNILGSDKDQTNTDIAIKLADEYLAHQPQFTKYTSEVKAFKQQASEQKAHYELMICEFHKKRGSLKAVKKRLASLEKDFSDLLPPEINSQVLALKEELYQHEEKIHIS